MAEFTLIPFNELEKSQENITFKAEANWSDDSLYLSYNLTGQIELVDFGNYLVNKTRAKNLWESTCFEFFLCQPSGEYLEFNFSPNFAWNIFTFETLRAPIKELKNCKNVEIDILNSSDKFTLIAQIKKIDLPLEFARNTSDLKFGITAVIKNNMGINSYWALTHKDSKPNFHHYDSFIGKF